MGLGLHLGAQVEHGVGGEDGSLLHRLVVQGAHRHTYGVGVRGRG